MQPVLEMSRRTLIKTGTVTLGAVGLATALSSPAVASARTQAQQHDWRWCNYCQCLFYEKDYTSGCCSKGCGHNWRGSGNYYAGYGEGPGQAGWCWCKNCENMWWGGSTNKGKCAEGGGHVKDGSGDYYIHTSSSSGEQSGWKWCNKCYCLCYSGVNKGHCAAKGTHKFDGSGSYFLAYG
jgi:hypothetical protein